MSEIVKKSEKPKSFFNPNPQAYASEMKEYNQWVLSCLKARLDGTYTKIPCDENGHYCDCTDPNNCGSFETRFNICKENPDKFSGIGFSIYSSCPIKVIDFDHVYDPETGVWNQQVLEELKRLNTRVEWSPSHTGVHALFMCSIMLESRKKTQPDGTGREMYFDKHYITVPAEVVEGFQSTINEVDPELIMQFRDKWFHDKKEAPVKTGIKTASNENLPFEIPEPIVNKPDRPLKDLFLSKDQVITLCRNAPNGLGEKFDRLFKGNISGYTNKKGEPDESRADLAIAGMIAFHTSDYWVIKEVIQESALWDEKWQRKDYCERTIMKAIENSRWRKANQATNTIATQSDTIESEKTDLNEPVLPKEYEIHDESLKVKKVENKTKLEYYETICHSPIMLTGVSQDIDTGEISYEVSFLDSLGHHHKEMYKQEELITANKLKQTTLASKINLIDAKTNDLCQYFNISIKENAQYLPRTKTVSKYGWRKEDSYVVGNRMITKNGTEEVIPVDEDNSLISKGSLEGWIEAVKPVICDNTVRFKCYCALTSMLLKPLNVQSFLVDHAGDSSQGKTFGFQVAVSMCGNPIELQLAANSSLTFMELKAASCNDLPLFFDETSLQSSELLTKLIYMIANEVGRGRATHATLQAVNRWKTVALITGELTIVSTNLNGAAIRVILIRKKMKTMPVGVVEKTLVGISKNYGHIIELFMEKVLKNKDELKSKFDGILKQFMHKDQSTMINRSASAYAAIATAGLILEDVFTDIEIPNVDPVRLVREFFNETIENPNEPYSIKALRYLYDYTQIHRNNFIIKDNDLNLNREIFGYISKDYIDMYKPSTKDALKEGNFNTSVIEDWIKEGIIIVNKGRQDFKITPKVNGSQHYVYRFEIAKVIEKLGN